MRQGQANSLRDAVRRVREAEETLARSQRREGPHTNTSDADALVKAYVHRDTLIERIRETK